MLSDELPKAAALASKGLADDYIILTNHGVTGASDIAIKAAFEKAGVKRCRVFGLDWIDQQIRGSARLRMLAPRLYGLADLTGLLDERAYQQAQLILSAMGDSLQRLVVTDAHRKSVRALNEHSFVLLLGAPAAGKSTIGASLALGAADLWGSSTIKATSPQDIQKHLAPGEKQFFWVDDAWGSTQYQRETSEAWNQTFPLIHGAMREGTKFLFTSRSYIWVAARRDLKLASLPVLAKSHVVIDVQKLTTPEKAQILYNHVKLGDQPSKFRSALKPLLPEIAKRDDFLPEVARRLGSAFFAGNLVPRIDTVSAFFERPEAFLVETIEALSRSSQAAIALVFLNGGRTPSPVEGPMLETAVSAFGTTPATCKAEMTALDGSLLLLAQGEEGPYWTYKHPTVGDAFATFVAKDPELVQLYLQGARADTILREVVCAGETVYGAPVVVPNQLHGLLADRIGALSASQLISFLSYRSNAAFSALILSRRPDIFERLTSFFTPIKDDMDAQLVAKLHAQGLLPEEIRLGFVERLSDAAAEEADSSFLEDEDIGAVLTDGEREALLDRIDHEVLQHLDSHVDRLRDGWDSDYPPDDYFDDFRRSIGKFVEARSDKVDPAPILARMSSEVRFAVSSMEEDYQPSSTASAPTQQSAPNTEPLVEMFRDVDE
ncbi:hypothetical protein [Brevundimonas sp.]|jgi:hypothetical protein|uniref:nSTAND3 domain-containing NTPase n=1 Tax=Brevundimonas sp. TaxID=1871086 RepID=UPI002E10E5EC|nr:hypothetical protein [Brevundimonas sp.]